MLLRCQNGWRWMYEKYDGRIDLLCLTFFVGQISQKLWNDPYGPLRADQHRSQHIRNTD
jgi:hypothetical protein